MNALSVRSYLVMLTVAVLLPVLGFAGWVLLRFAEAEQARMRHDSQELVQILAADIDRELAAYRMALQMLATSPLLEHGDLEGFHAQAMEFLRREGLHVVMRDLDGQQLVNTRMPFGAPLPRVPAFETDRQVLQTGKPAVSDLFVGAVAREPLVLVNVPVIRDGRVVYLLNLSLPVSMIGAILDRQPLLPDAVAGVADRKGAVIWRTRAPERFIGQTVPPDVLRLADDKGTGWYRLDNLEGIPTFNVYSRSKLAGWIVAISVPEAVVEAPLRHSLILIGGVGGGLLLLSLVLAFGVGRKVAEPMTALAAMAAAIGRGEAVAAPRTPVREVNLVAEELAASAAEVRKAAGALEDMNASLEEKVASRTAELVAVNGRLAESEQRFRAIFDSTFQFTGLLTPDGTLLEANRTALDFGGLHREQVVGRKLWETRWWSASQGEQDRLRDAIIAAASGEFVRYEVEVQGRGETRALIDFSLKPIRDDDGCVVLLVPEGRDITLRRRAEAQLFQSQKMESLGQLTGGVAHDFNNLLQIIAANVTLLGERAEDDATRGLLAQVREAVERGAKLTRQLVAFARRQALSPRPADLAALVIGMGDLLQRSMGGLIAVEIRPDADCWPAMADINQLELAVLNLAINARDAMPDGGTLTISVGNRRIGPRDRDPPAGLGPGDYVRLRVADTGIGMSEEVAERAFEPFFTTKEVGKGTGLGLSMVHGMAAQLGGGARIISRPGEGTAVELFLPRSPLPVEPVVPAPPPVPGRVAARILIVDDEPLVRAGIVALLTADGHEAIEAASAGEALALLRGGERFDLLLTDFAMPGMNGIELIAAARSLRPDLPVIVATGHVGDIRIDEGVFLLSKPFRPAELVRLLGQVLAAPALT